MAPFSVVLVAITVVFLFSVWVAIVPSQFVRWGARLFFSLNAYKKHGVEVLPVEFTRILKTQTQEEAARRLRKIMADPEREAPSATSWIRLNGIAWAIMTGLFLAVMLYMLFVDVSLAGPVSW